MVKKPETTPPITPKKGKRPLLILLLCVILAGLCIFGWIRFQQAIQEWSLEAALVSPLLPIYLTLSGAFWGLAGVPAIIGLWKPSRWALSVTWFVAIFYPLTFWLEKTLLLKSPTRLVNWQFDAGVTILWLLFVTLALHLPNNRRYLRG